MYGGIVVLRKPEHAPQLLATGLVQDGRSIIVDRATIILLVRSSPAHRTNVPPRVLGEPKISRT